jgi:prephenate dehydratase
MKIITYQGVKGSFSYLTALRLFGESCEFKGFPTFKEAFEAVENGAANLALLPIENTLAGTIYETLDLLNEGCLKIIGVTNTRIEHSLIGLPDANLSGIYKVLSHPKALAQCTRFLSEHPHMKAVSHYDTAGSAKDVASGKDPMVAAIAHSIVADIYGLKVLVEGIEDHKENYTRFFLLSKEESKGKKCSLCFTLEHREGSLAEMLATLARYGVNLTYIVSRPLIGKPFEYMFYVDLETPDPHIVETIGKKVNSLKVLGHYNVIT